MNTKKRNLFNEVSEGFAALESEKKVSALCAGARLDLASQTNIKG